MMARQPRRKSAPLSTVLRLKRSPASSANGPSFQGPSDGGSDVFDYLVAQIQAQGYAILDAPLPEPVLNQLFLYFTALDREAFKQAGIGRQHDYQLNEFLRRDRIHWLSGSDAEVEAYYAWMERLRLCINSRLFLGLFDYECHYAYYPEGAFYKKHVDAFRGQSNRRLSTILYLNPNWQAGDGGELALYHEDENAPFHTVEPVYGRMVIFLSEVFPHEVLRANRGRFSLTGWYRVNGAELP